MNITLFDLEQENFDSPIKYFLCLLLPWVGSWSLLMSTNFLCEFNVRLTLSVVTWPLFWRAQFVELCLWINTMYRLWDISLYSFSYGHYLELHEKCQFKRQVTQFIFEIMSKTTSSSKKRKYTVADAVEYVGSVFRFTCAVESCMPH